MSAQYLFDRAWAVTIGKQGEQGRTYTQLKTIFDIEKTSRSTSNKAKIGLYNLNSESRASFVKGLTIRLEAGYNGLKETLYFGDIQKVTHERKKTEIITTFECGDGERQLVNAHFDKSYPPGTSFVDIVKDLAAALGVSIGTVIGIEQEQYNSGFVATGTVKYSLDKMLKKQGLEWSIQNGSLQICPIDAHNGEEAIVLNKDTGLIGLPSQGLDCITFKALLNPKLMPGQPVQIGSETLNGFFKIRKAHFEGDSHGNKWDVQCEAVKINAVQSFPQNSGLDFNTVGGTA